MSFQNRFIEYVKEMVPDHISLVDEISDLLSVSKDSAYRRLRNDTPFTLDESIAISRHFNLNIHELFQNSAEQVNFRYNKLYDEKDSFLKYLQNLMPSLEYIGYHDGCITYAAEDVPLFHHFGYKQLCAFKLFYWSKSVLNSNTYQGQKFNKKLIHPDILEAAKKLYIAYNKVRSIEIWTEESVNSSLRQIVYFAESGQFEQKQQAYDVIEDFATMIKNLQTKAEKSSKLSEESSVHNFTLYNSEVLIGNNCILLEAKGNKQVFISHNTFNSLSTKNPEFCAETENWIQNLIRKSTLISDVSEKHRFQFFKKVNMTIDQTLEQVRKMDF